MLGAMTQKGGYLVQVNELFGCYISSDGTYIREVDDIDKEIEWAKGKWRTYKEESLPADIEATLIKCLEYVDGYQRSLLVLNDED